ncbi:hypothetical protein [Thalassiella azotivora]
MNTLELAVTLSPFVAGAWAAWWFPRWAGGSHDAPADPTRDWSSGDLPTRPYRDLERL